MRTVHWLFIVGLLLFVFGIGFVIAGARASRHASQADVAVSPPAPVASVKQIMTAIVLPAATAVFDSVSTTVTRAGTETKAPGTDAEWAALGASAAALAESGNLLTVGNRVVDRGDWLLMSRALVDAGLAAMKAADAKDADGILAAGEAVTISCDNCHRKYQRS